MLVNTVSLLKIAICNPLSASLTSFILQFLGPRCFYNFCPFLLQSLDDNAGNLQIGYFNLCYGTHFGWETNNQNGVLWSTT